MAALLEAFDTHQLTAIAEFLARSTDFSFRHAALLRAETLGAVRQTGGRSIQPKSSGEGSFEKWEARAAMTPAFRKLNLTAHVTCSVDWLGAVGGFLALSIAGLSSQDTDMVRGAYLAMNLIGQFVIIPLSLAALLTGLVQSLGTDWGLFRHYWVLVKFTLTIGLAMVLLLHQFTAVAEAARRASGAAVGTLPQVGRLGIQLVGDAAAAVLVLLVTTTLSVYKPWGRIRYGRGRQQQERHEALEGTPLSTPPVPSTPGNVSARGGLPLGFKVSLAVVGVIGAAFVLVHPTGHGLGSHGH